MRVFITGVSSGIGRQLAKLLVKDGHEVWGIARRRELLESLKSELNSDKFFYSQCDVSKHEEVERAMKEMAARDFHPDVVVLGSAIFPKDLSEGFDFFLTEEVFKVNFFGALTWIEKFLPKFLERGFGKFIAISSTSAFRPDVQSVSLPASKAALSMAMRSLRLRYEKENIKFITVYFGPVATSIVPEYSSGKKKHFFVMSPGSAAKKLKKAVFGNKREYYFPFWLTLLFRLGLIFPDSWFSRISQFLKK